MGEMGLGSGGRTRVDEMKLQDRVMSNREREAGKSKLTSNMVNIIDCFD